jgi:hypothetical protein
MGNEKWWVKKGLDQESRVRLRCQDEDPYIKYATDPDPAALKLKTICILNQCWGSESKSESESERFEGSESESDQLVRIRIRFRKDPKANFI